MNVKFTKDDRLRIYGDAQMSGHLAHQLMKSTGADTSHSIVHLPVDGQVSQLLVKANRIYARMCTLKKLLVTKSC